jgi:preprotein translocase subunit SecF
MWLSGSIQIRHWGYNATFHDVMAVLGIFTSWGGDKSAASQRFNIAGYSLTDTVVVFDN